MRSYVTAVVLGHDIVARLSYRSLCYFRNEILYAIARAKVNKFFIVQAIVRNYDSTDLMYEKGEEPDSEFKTAYIKYKVCAIPIIIEYLTISIQDSVDEQLADPTFVDLYIPGRIVHLVKTRIGMLFPVGFFH
jgi:hypothetical protein